MARRTVVILDEDVYETLVRESLSKYGTTRAISKVLNELVRQAIRLEGLLEVKKFYLKRKRLK